MKGCEYSASDYSFAWPEYQSSIMLTHINLQSDSQEKEAQEKYARLVELIKPWEAKDA